MFEKKMNWKGYAVIIVLGLLWLFVAFLAVLTLVNPKAIWGEEDIPSSFETIGIALIIMVWATFVVIPPVIGVIKQLIKYKKVIMRIDQAGIHNTFVSRSFESVLPLFSFFIFIRFIPWSAVIQIDQSNTKKTRLLVRVDDKQVQFTNNKKSIFSIGEFNFCQGFTSKLTMLETNIILSYLQNQIPTFVETNKS